jgi:gas vesicle protein
MKQFGSFIFGVIAGALVGSLCALLFTPIKGSALRARLGSSIVNVRDEVKNAAKLKMDELNQQLATLQNKPVVK